MSMLETSLLFGGQVVRSIDLATGEIIAMREQVSRSNSGGGILAGNPRVDASLATAHISPRGVKRIDKSTTPTLPQALTAQVLTAQVLTAQALTAQALTAQTLTAQALTAQALTAQALTAQVLTAQVLTGTKKAVGEGSSAP
jgi:hypothetical protein